MVVERTLRTVFIFFVLSFLSLHQIAYASPTVTLTALSQGSSSYISPQSIALTANATVSEGTINTNGIVFTYAPVVNGGSVGTQAAIRTSTLTAGANI